MISQLLTPSQIERIHRASLRILERVGVLVPHEDMLSHLAEAGATVERDRQRSCCPKTW